MLDAIVHLIGSIPALLQQLVSQFKNLPYPTTDWTGKTVIVTGASAGIGLEAARHFVRLNAAKVIIACRDLEKGATARADIEASTQTSGVIEIWQLDLGSFESVKEFCRRAKELGRLDAVVENAGVLTSHLVQLEGYEEQITVNVISPFLIALLVLPILRRTAVQNNTTPHLTIVSSDAHVHATLAARKASSIFEVFRQPAQDLTHRYDDSKLLEVLFARELARGMTESQKTPVILNTVNPALCRSTLFRDVPWPLSWVIPISLLLIGRTSEVGSRNLLAAAGAGPESHGKYISDCKIFTESRFVRSEEGAKVQKRVYDELLGILERVEPGISTNI
ncbi:short-chain dehydrogenase [Xylariales sp. PMI_506]|nr:short-chain dehydrogenase [Xylariales sp. PMI_506]